MIGDGTFFLDGKVSENFEILDLKWCNLVNFGTISIMAQISIILPLLTGLETLFLKGKVLENTEIEMHSSTKYIKAQVGIYPLLLEQELLC